MIPSECWLGPAQRRGYGEDSENLAQCRDMHDIIPCTKNHGTTWSIRAWAREGACNWMRNAGCI